LDPDSRSSAYPLIQVNNASACVLHEATMGKVDPFKLFYMTSRGMNLDRVLSLMVNGFMDPIIKEIPLEYAVEMNRLIQSRIKF